MSDSYRDRNPNRERDRDQFRDRSDRDRSDRDRRDRGEGRRDDRDHGDRYDDGRRRHSDNQNGRDRGNYPMADNGNGRHLEDDRYGRNGNGYGNGNGNGHGPGPNRGYEEVRRPPRGRGPAPSYRGEFDESPNSHPVQASPDYRPPPPESKRTRSPYRERDDSNKRLRGEHGGDGGDGGEPGPSRGRGDGNGRGRGDGRGRGRGDGRGRGRGGRGARRGNRYEDEYDMVVSRPRTDEGAFITKKAVLGNSMPIRLQSNFFTVECRPNWAIHHYRVDFLPDETDTRVKKKLLRAHSEMLGAYVFDGSSLYTANMLSSDPMELYSSRDTDNENIQLIVRKVGELNYTDIMYLQLFNIIVRKCLETMDLEEMGRHFYDRHQAIRIDAHQLELWPGYKTSMRNHESAILLNVEITHKVLRLDTCLHVINNMRGRKDEKRIRDELVGTIVMTTYTRKTYRVDDIQWDTTPLSTFDMRGRQVSFVDYFKERYRIDIRDMRQPMLVSRPKKKDFHRGMTGPILLIPELCQMTGITDDMRANNQLMKAVAQHLHTDPVRRVERIKDFMRRMRSSDEIQNELTRWGLKFSNNLVNFEGHTINKETIMFGDHKTEKPNDYYDWGRAFRDYPLLSTVPLRTWVVIVPSQDSNIVEKLVSSMQRVSNPLRFTIANPATIKRLSETRPNDYAKAVDQVMNEYRERVQMLFVILPRQVPDIYAAVKKRACIEFGVPSQCFVARNAHNQRGIMSICTKLVVQMSAKLGGEPWKVSIPLKNLMVVGFDVYHCGKRRGSSVGAMVATTSDTLAKYFSCVSFHSTREDLSENLGQDFNKCLMAYKNINQTLPDRVIMYRDAVGDGQLQYVYETELSTMQRVLETLYRATGRDPPKFTFIVVTKRINTRLFSFDRDRHTNPPPGTVADDIITLPERYDFYLVSQHAKQGTVSPVAYNVLFDRQGLDADKLQKLTFKLCHLYFNWSGTVTVPAPCQYAHKLAYLTGTALGERSNEKLSNLLFYL